MATYSDESYQLRLRRLDVDDDDADEYADDEQLAADCSYDDVDADDAAADGDDAAVGDRGRDDVDDDDDVPRADSGDKIAV